LRSVASETIWLPKETFAEFEAVIASVDCFAGVMICPENWSENDLRQIFNYCRRTSTVLIFDEIKSGIRYGPRGVANSLDLAPDLICLGKSIANGFPLAVLAGRSELMSFSNDVHFSTTAASEGISLAASLAVDNYLRTVEAWPPWQERCQGIMSRVRSVISAINPKHELTISGYPGNFRVHTLDHLPVSDPFRKVFISTLANHGIFSTGYISPCASHAEEDFARLEVALVEAISEWEPE
jgi:glutamate-1-semialdehyde 2,1-aminomutase